EAPEAGSESEGRRAQGPRGAAREERQGESDVRRVPLLEEERVRHLDQRRQAGRDAGAATGHDGQAARRRKIPHVEIREEEMKTLARAALPMLALAGCAPTETTAPLPAESYRALLASPVRTERDRGMDQRRDPVNLLQFANVRPGMRVLDIATGAGYTSQMLALAVGESGKLWAQTQTPGAALKERLAAHPQPNFIVTARPFEDPIPPEAAPLDLVTLVLNYHDITYLPVDRDAMNRKVFAALKPGGHYIIVDHSALPGTGI